jgi:hypothetical protein
MTTHRHRYQRPRSAWVTRLAIAGGAVVVVAGAAVVLALLWARPQVSVSSSSLAMFDLQVKGLGTKLVAEGATSAGRPLVLVREAGGLAPTGALAQGQTVQVTATASPPKWLRWLVGDRVTTTRTLTTPMAAPAASIAVTSGGGQVPVRFDHPVSVVDYRGGGGPIQVARLAHPATVVNLEVPSQASAGSLEVAAAPLSWETVARDATTVTWFDAPSGGGSPALVDPAPGTATAAPNVAISLTFAQPVAAVLGASRPSVTPSVAGSWSEPAANTLVFTPTGFGFGPGTAVTVTFDRAVSVTGAGGHFAPPSTTYQFRTSPGSPLRMEEILAQLGYLPLRFVPAPGVIQPTTFAAEVATVSQPLAGSFQWRWASTPASLQAQWTVGSPNVLLKGALMAFESNESSSFDGFTVSPETVSQVADGAPWEALLQAALSHQMDPNPYSYVYVTQSLPETLTLWENGSVVMTTPANTGIPESPTANGTFPIYVRYSFNYMSGFNPDGSYYHDPVYWINYFNGGDAVHGFVRGSYGWPQSLGCVELPVSTAEVAFSHLAIGDLVTVAD